jgi:hypothetical protein
MSITEPQMHVQEVRANGTTTANHRHLTKLQQQHQTVDYDSPSAAHAAST